MRRSNCIRVKDGGEKTDIVSVYREQGDKNLDIKMKKIKEECTEECNYKRWF